MGNITSNLALDNIYPAATTTQPDDIAERDRDSNVGIAPIEEDRKNDCIPATPQPSALPSSAMPSITLPSLPRESQTSHPVVCSPSSPTSHEHTPTPCNQIQSIPLPKSTPPAYHDPSDEEEDDEEEDGIQHAHTCAVWLRRQGPRSVSSAASVASSTPSQRSDPVLSPKPHPPHQESFLHPNVATACPLNSPHLLALPLRANMASKPGYGEEGVEKKSGRERPEEGRLYSPHYTITFDNVEQEKVDEKEGRDRDEASQPPTGGRSPFLSMSLSSPFRASLRRHVHAFATPMPAVMNPPANAHTSVRAAVRALVASKPGRKEGERGEEGRGDGEGARTNRRPRGGKGEQSDAGEEDAEETKEEGEKKWREGEEKKAGAGGGGGEGHDSRGQGSLWEGQIEEGGEGEESEAGGGGGERWGGLVEHDDETCPPD
ncbi:hypothetical protein Naga_100703g3 [Nannochloropsis gaditana]|uniref:Uncharacterized protein n=1 Tax=Nannochloropsis gaditana TaxID=72520 RepID=W7TRW0_9STRA|nr:hypothetical protein Naga_100703g3 [Nannochloropsis gaditana]